MSATRMARMALRKVLGSRQTGMLPRGANKTARREASAANIEDAAVLQPNRARAQQMNNAALRMRTTTRTNNAAPVSAVKPSRGPNSGLDALRNGTATPKQLYELRLQSQANGLAKPDMDLLAKAEKASKRKWNPARTAEE